MISPGSTAPAQPLVVRPLWSLVGPALGALLAVGLLTAPIGPLASAIKRDLALSTAAMTVTVVASCMVAMASLVAPGYLLGRRWPTATGVPALVLLIVGSAVSAFAPGAALLVAGRVLVGLGAGTVVGVAIALSGQLGRWRSRARLVLGLALGAALLLGPVLSGMLTMALGWRPAFLVDVPVAIFGLVAVVANGIAMSVASGSRPSPPAAPAPATQFPGQPGPAAQGADNAFAKHRPSDHPHLPF
ncbi:MFS transporter [Micromonospora foliorum]|uniref:MFS transporter n=1 Tax=Micromonospora foliorum TaxID=2911210 RepID=UPI001EE8D945|nr:MFS transporter [Micromonospora foliorum]MCG5434681.1 MFS transporter [Micromonospora foliorum]